MRFCLSYIPGRLGVLFVVPDSYVDPEYRDYGVTFLNYLVLLWASSWFVCLPGIGLSLLNDSSLPLFRVYFCSIPFHYIINPTYESFPFHLAITGMSMHCFFEMEQCVKHLPVGHLYIFVPSVILQLFAIPSWQIVEALHAMPWFEC
jgi:hypothetical protein